MEEIRIGSPHRSQDSAVKDVTKDQEQQNPNGEQEDEATTSSRKPKRARSEENDDLRRSQRSKKPVERLQVTPAGASLKAKRAKRGLSRVDESRLTILHNKTWYVNYVQHPPGPNMTEVRFEDLPE